MWLVLLLILFIHTFFLMCKKYYRQLLTIINYVK